MVSAVVRATVMLTLVLAHSVLAAVLFGYGFVVVAARCGGSTGAGGGLAFAGTYVALVALACVIVIWAVFMAIVWKKHRAWASTKQTLLAGAGILLFVSVVGSACGFLVDPNCPAVSVAPYG